MGFLVGLYFNRLSHTNTETFISFIFHVILVYEHKLQFLYLAAFSSKQCTVAKTFSSKTDWKWCINVNKTISKRMNFSFSQKKLKSDWPLFKHFKGMLKWKIKYTSHSQKYVKHNQPYLPMTIEARSQLRRLHCAALHRAAQRLPIGS